MIMNYNKKTTLLLLSLLLSFTQLFAQQLRFNPQKTFKIVQFTDVHWVPGNVESEAAAEIMNEVLDAEKPDLVVYTGDLIFAKPASQALDAALAPTIKHNIPFAVVFGNHDDEQDMTKNQLFEYIKNKPGNLTNTTQGITGVTNYVLPLKSSTGNRDAAILYFLDSNTYSPLSNVKGYDWIKLDQIDWYKKTSDSFKKENSGNPLPAVAFYHIPIPEFSDAITSDTARFVGTRKEKVSSPKLNSGLFTAMMEQGDIIANFVGHDHVNDYVAYWNGILLGYGRFTGGKTVYNDIPGGNGARVIELKEGSRSLKTWERLRGGRIVNIVEFPSDFVETKN